MIDGPVNRLETDGGLKSRLVDVSISLLGELQALKVPTMREIATEAGVAPGAAYRHFSSQAELLVAVATELFDRLGSALAVVNRVDESPARVIRGLAHAYVNWGVANPGGYQLLFNTPDDADALAREQRPGMHLIEDLAKLLGHCVDTDLPDPTSASMLWVHLHGLVSLRIHKTGMNWPASVELQINQIVDLTLSSLSRN